MRGHWALLITFTHIGNFELALDHFEKALALYDPAQHRDDSFLYALNPGVAMPCFAAWTLWFLGQPDQALVRIEEALSLARELYEPQGLAHAYFFASALYQLRRDHLMAQHYAQAATDISREHGLVLYEAMAMIMQGWTLNEQGRDQESLEQFQEGLTALDATGTSLLRPHFLGLMAQAFSKVNQNENAILLLEEAMTMVSNKGEGYFEAELYRLKGEVLFKQHQAAAEECFKQSMAIAESQNAKSLQLRTAMSLARLYNQKTVLSQVYESFTEGFDTDDLREAKALLH